MDIDALWEYGDPAASEERFRVALDGAAGDERLELLTQIARTYSLRKRFDDAQRLLDEVEGQLGGAGPRPRVCCLLERGRSFNSAGDPERARPLFVEACDRFRAAGISDGHHVGRIDRQSFLTGSPEAIVWNQRGLSMARGSQDARARGLIAAMLNNTAWDLHDMGRFDEALALFEEAQTEWMARGKPGPVRAAKWAVARCLRSLGRYDQALALQQALEREDTAAGTVDGSVLEELGENLAALNRLQEARPYFAKAAQELGKDAWFVEHEAARLAALKEKGRETRRG